jgi:hypothetical protein
MAPREVQVSDGLFGSLQPSDILNVSGLRCRCRPLGALGTRRWLTEKPVPECRLKKALADLAGGSRYCLLQQLPRSLRVDLRRESPVTRADPASQISRPRNSHGDRLVVTEVRIQSQALPQSPIDRCASLPRVEVSRGRAGVILGVLETGLACETENSTRVLCLTVPASDAGRLGGGGGRPEAKSGLGVRLPGFQATSWESWRRKFGSFAVLILPSTDTSVSIQLSL